MSKIKIAIVGIGKIARDQHLPELARSDDFDLIAAASRNASVDGVRTYASLDALLTAEPTIEAVSLCTPPGPREADARLALSRGLHVLLEKPPAATLGAARDLIARAQTSVLNMSWHSRHARGVATARDWLSARQLLSAEIIWKEDIRKWHPGQDWILDVGGMGVFDPAINALSILTELISERLILTGAELGVPANRQAPITSELALHTSAGAAINASLDFLQTGQQTWDIRVETDDGHLTLTQGGARLAIDGKDIEIEGAHSEYAGVYHHFAQCIRNRTSDCDLRPLEIVADAFLFGRRTILPPFTF